MSQFVCNMMTRKNAMNKKGSESKRCCSLDYISQLDVWRVYGSQNMWYVLSSSPFFAIFLHTLSQIQMGPEWVIELNLRSPKWWHWLSGNNISLILLMDQVCGSQSSQSPSVISVTNGILGGTKTTMIPWLETFPILLPSLSLLFTICLASSN